MTSSESLFSKVTIESDDTGGVILLSLAKRIGEKRKTKVKNNFTGLLQPADSTLMTRLSEILADKVGDIDETVVVGMHKSGIVAAAYLGLARKTRFAWTTPDKIGQDCIEYYEDHRPDRAHYLYGIGVNDRVLLVEDEITSGIGIAGLAKMLTENGVSVVGIASYLETLNFDGRKRIHDMTGLELQSLARIRLS